MDELNTFLVFGEVNNIVVIVQLAKVKRFKVHSLKPLIS